MVGRGEFMDVHEASIRGKSVSEIARLSVRGGDRRPANSGPGEIYPDGLDVPTAGCWRFDLRWANGRATVDLEYM